MQATFWTAVQARNALIDGRLASARAAAATLATGDYSALPEATTRGVPLLRQSAKELSMAANMNEAAQALGRVAVSCSECHSQQEHGPLQLPFQPAAWESTPEQLEQRMDRHQTGIEQMWEGLIVPSEQAWQRGTVTLMSAPLAPPTQASKPIDSSMEARIEQVRSLAKQAQVAGSQLDRARVYGELIARCAACHSVARR